jgi:hypothetical protein
VEPGRRGDSIAGRMFRRLAGDDSRVTRCAVCNQRIVVDRHCVRRGDAFLHAHCALYRRPPVRAA